VAGLLLDRGVPVRVGKVRGDAAVQRAIAHDWFTAETVLGLS
jgi:hypothetical protein